MQVASGCPNRRICKGHCAAAATTAAADRTYLSLSPKAGACGPVGCLGTLPFVWTTRRLCPNSKPSREPYSAHHPRWS